MPHMNSTVAPPSIELVLLAENQAVDLEDTVRRLVRTLPDRVAGRWVVTIADVASSDGTADVAERLAATVNGVRVVHLEGRLDRKALRARWATSPAETVAFA